MGMQVGADSDDGLVSTINTTPLVDVMLVLLIIFLITIPVATHTVPVKLPTQAHQRYELKTNSIAISVTPDGRVYWDAVEVVGPGALLTKFEAIARQQPQPTVQIHGDTQSLYRPIGNIVKTAQQAGFQKLAFITKPEKP